MRRPGRGRSMAHPWTKTGKPALIFWETPGQKLQVSFLLIKHQRIFAPSLKPTQDLLQPGQCLELFLSLGPEVQGRDHRGPWVYPRHHHDRRCHLSSRKEEVGGRGVVGWHQHRSWSWAVGILTLQLDNHPCWADRMGDAAGTGVDD